jgi:inosine-uridine nucleoside N-ribohydrolase
VDDAFALLVLLHYCSRPENNAELIAVTTTHGNVDLEIVQVRAQPSTL